MGSTTPQLGEFESDIEAMKLLTLVVRDIEAIIELAKIDLVLVSAANILARAAFEIAVKAAWMVTPDDPFEREVRWLAHLQEEERMHERIAGRVAQFGGNPASFQQQRDNIRAFRTGVIDVLPPGYTPLPGNPSVEQMLGDIGQKRVYSIYTLLAAYVHGSHSATSLYRRNLGTFKEHGEFVDAESWYLALWTSSKTLHVLGSYVLDHLKATNPESISDDQQIEDELHLLSGEQAN